MGGLQEQAGAAGAGGDGDGAVILFVDRADAFRTSSTACAQE